MNDVRVAAAQVGYEQKAYWRNPMAAIFTFAFPIIFLLVVGGSAGPSRVPGYTLRYDQYVVVAMLAFGLIAACYTNLAMVVCTRRDSGVLKRMRGTPIAVGSYIAGLIGSVLIVVAILTVIVVTLGLAFYHLHFPYHPGAVLLTLLVGIVTFSALGLAVTILVPNADAAPAIVNEHTAIKTPRTRSRLLFIVSSPCLTFIRIRFLNSSLTVNGAVRNAL